jgi:hypothetical protein
MDPKVDFTAFQTIGDWSDYLSSSKAMPLQQESHSCKIN